MSRQQRLLPGDPGAADLDLEVAGLQLVYKVTELDKVSWRASADRPDWGSMPHAEVGERKQMQEDETGDSVRYKESQETAAPRSQVEEAF